MYTNEDILKQPLTGQTVNKRDKEDFEDNQKKDNSEETARNVNIILEDKS
jgi:hypothetical protein